MSRAMVPGGIGVGVAHVASACGGGVIQSEDVPLGTALVIAVVVIAALLYIGYVGGRK
ncbi:MAG: hypothetical protein ABR575_07020 [Actinomycetota bacterium]